MATENVGILTNAGQALLQQVNAGKTKITYTRVVFSTDDNSQLADADIKALTDVKTQNVTIKPPVVTEDPQTGETIIRAVGDNKNLTDGIYIHTYGVYAADDSGKEVLYGVTVTSTPDYLVGYDGMMAQAVAYSYRANIQSTDNVNFTDAGDVYLMQKDLQGYLANYVPVSQLTDYAKKTDLNGLAKQSDLTGLASESELNQKQDKATAVNTTDDQEIAGKKTFDTAPINKGDNKPYITATAQQPQNSTVTADAQDGSNAWVRLGKGTEGLPDANNPYDVRTINAGGNLVQQALTEAIPDTIYQRTFTSGGHWTNWHAVGSVPDDVAKLDQDANFTGKLQKGGKDVLTSDNLPKTLTQASKNDQTSGFADSTTDTSGFYFWTEQ